MTIDLNMNVVAATPVTIIKEDKQVKNYKKIPTKTLAEIRKMKFPEPEFLVQGMIPKSGMGLLMGNPKAGKSFMALHLIHCISKGIPFLGREVMQGSVMYLAFEDPRSRIDWRTQAVEELLSVSECDNLEINCQDDEWLATVANGGLNSLQGWINETPDARVIVIDTIQLFQGVRKGGGDAYQLDVEALSPIQRLALRNNISIICIHHLNKAGFTMGSQGYESTADWILKLWKEDKDPTARLEAKGRDYEEFAETLERDKVYPDDKRGYIWKSLGDAHKYIATKESDEVFKAANFIEMDRHSKRLPYYWTVDDLMESETFSKTKKNTISQRLKRMVGRNELENPLRSYYMINFTHFTIGYEREPDLERCPYGR
jgi:RecA-family ATPase